MHNISKNLIRGLFVRFFSSNTNVATTVDTPIREFSCPNILVNKLTKES